MTVESTRYEIPSATLEPHPDGGSVLTCPLCGKTYFKAADAALAEQELAAHTIRLDGRP